MEIEKVNTLEFLKSFLFDDFDSYSQQDQDGYTKFMQQFVSNLYDETKQVIIPLNKKYTEFSRRFFCSKEINKKCFYSDYSNEYSTNKKIIINNLKNILHKYIIIKSNNLSNNYRNTLNSIYACSDYQKYYHMPLGCLDFKITMLSQFVGIECYEVADVLSYTRTELRRLFEYITVKRLNQKFSNLGLKFAEELTTEEKRKIISYASDGAIMNSDISWIQSDKRYRYNYKTIGDFIKNANNHNVDISLDLLHYLKDIGMNFAEFDERIKELENANDSSNVLDKPIYQLPLSTQVKNALFRTGIFDIKTLITYSIDDLANIKRITYESALEIEKIVNSFGLSLKQSKKDIKHR